MANDILLVVIKCTEASLSFSPSVVIALKPQQYHASQEVRVKTTMKVIKYENLFIIFILKGQKYK